MCFEFQNKFWKTNCQSPDRKDVNLFEIDDSDIALASPELILVDSDHDDDKQNKIDHGINSHHFRGDIGILMLILKKVK